MMDEQYFVLAFEIDDTHKIVKNLLNKKKKILAITPNAFEILKKNKFENIFTPEDFFQKIHERLATDNIELRNILKYKLSSNLKYDFINQSFNNILIQSFSTLNFLYILLEQEPFYYSYFNKKFELRSNTELYNKIISKIVLEKYGIFKISKKNTNKNYYLKKTINNFLFFFLKKKKITFNFLGINKKLSYSNKDIEITFGSLSNSNLINIFIIFKSFLEFFFKNKIKRIYPEIKYKFDFELKKRVSSFLKETNLKLFKNINHEFLIFLSENILYEKELQKFLTRRFNVLKTNFLFADHLTWLDNYILSKFLYEKKKEIILCSHGMMDISDNKFEKNELISLASGLCSSEYLTTVISQTPSAYEFSKKHLIEKKIRIIKAHPFAYHGLRNKEKNNTNKTNILFAGTYKVFLSRPYIYQGSFQFFNNIKKLVLIFKNLKDVNLIFNIRTNDEIDNSFYKELSKDIPNIQFIFNGDIEKLMQKSQILISNFSTLIDEFSYLKKPVIILKDNLKYYPYKNIYRSEENNENEENLSPIYYYNSKELKENLHKIIIKLKKKKVVETPRHIWREDEVLDNNHLLDKIN